MAAAFGFMPGLMVGFKKGDHKNCDHIRYLVFNSLKIH